VNRRFERLIKQAGVPGFGKRLRYPGVLPDAGRVGPHLFQQAGLDMISKTTSILKAGLLPLVAVTLTIAAVAAAGLGRAAREEKARVVPAPAIDEQRTANTSAVAVLAGGCFWGVQGVFQHTRGVTGAISGYAGGPQGGAKYELVSGGATGHAESVQVTYDPRQISFGRLLQVYFSVAHDPTQLNRQGPDSGPQYRSAIFPLDDEQARIASAYIAQLNAARAFSAPIVTRVEAGKTFYPAEDYHQDYLTRHASAPYIVMNDLPKIEDLKRLFPDLYRAAPVLVSSAK
jgi:peptide-methionine (S)-S-oxide reductase